MKAVKAVKAGGPRGPHDPRPEVQHAVPLPFVSFRLSYHSSLSFLLSCKSPGPGVTSLAPLVLVHVIRLLKVAVLLFVLLIVGRVLCRRFGVVNDHTARAAADHVVKVNDLLCVFFFVCGIGITVVSFSDANKV